MKESDQLTLREMLRRTARWYPNNEAVVDETTRYTYAQLLDSVQRCASLFHDLGIRKGDRIALMMYPSTIHCIALFAAFEMGALPVALHYRETAKGLSRIVDRLSPRLLVYEASMEEKAQELLNLCPRITEAVRAISSAPVKLSVHATCAAEIPADLNHYTLDFEHMPVYETDPAAIVLSSGTTGIPKGIIHTNRTFMEGARAAVYNYKGIQPSDAYLNILTTSFIAWYNSSLPFFNVGSKLVFRAKWDPKEYLETVQNEKITICFLVPTMWRMILTLDEIGKYDFSSVRLALFAGEVMDPTTMSMIKKKVCRHVINIYGSTEMGGQVCGIMFDDEMAGNRLSSVGKPSLNTDFRIIRPGGKKHDELPAGEAGEVIIRGPSVASMVWDDPAMARKIFESDGADTWWHSGDMGRLDEEGFLYLQGRTDDMIISGGINIMPARVEDVLLSHPDVAEAAVVGVADEKWGQKVKAFVVSKKKSGINTDELDRFMKQSELADYQRPRLYEFVATLPRTATGKINRKALRAER